MTEISGIGRFTCEKKEEGLIALKVLLQADPGQERSLVTCSGQSWDPVVQETSPGWSSQQASKESSRDLENLNVLWPPALISFVCLIGARVSMQAMWPWAQV